MISIRGKAIYVSLEMGFWGIQTPSGKKYLPINMPEQLKENGSPVACKAIVVDDVVSMQMWGTPVKIVSFETIGTSEQE